MRVDIDSSEVRQWVQQLDQAVMDHPDEVAKVVARGAFNIKRDARARAAQIGEHVRRYPYAITYETRRHVNDITAEIGPEVGKGQGSLGGILENGSPTSAPHPHMLPAGEAEAPRFEQAMQDLAARLLEER